MCWTSTKFKRPVKSVAAGETFSASEDAGKWSFLYKCSLYLVALLLTGLLCKTQKIFIPLINFNFSLSIHLFIKTSTKINNNLWLEVLVRPVGFWTVLVWPIPVPSLIVREQNPFSFHRFLVRFLFFPELEATNTNDNRLGSYKCFLDRWNQEKYWTRGTRVYNLLSLIIICFSYTSLPKGSLQIRFLQKTQSL